MSERIAIILSTHVYPRPGESVPVSIVGGIDYDPDGVTVDGTYATSDGFLRTLPCLSASGVYADRYAAILAGLRLVFEHLAERAPAATHGHETGGVAL